MKKKLGIIIIVGGFLCLTFMFKGVNKNYNLNINPETSLECTVLYRGFENAVDFTYDNKRDIYYVAFKDSIQILNNKGWGEKLYKDRNLNISSMEFWEDKLFYVSGTKVYSYDLKNRKSKVIIDEIPNYGDYENSLLKIKNDYIFLTIGAATNSGIVGKDNEWLKEYPHNHDITPKSLIIRGLNFGDEKTGAFVPYKTQNIKGQILTSHFPGNASVIIYNLKTEGIENYAWGIRNIKGMDFNSEEKLFAAVGGMEDRGLRPIKGDYDYIFNIKKSQWYGWPDYSGGDPVTSPRFKGKNNGTIPFILDKHPTTNPPAPIYQHNNLNSIGTMCIDVNGILEEKDSIYFSENNYNIIYELNKSRVLKKVAFIPKEVEIKSMKIFNDKMLVLDSKKGYIYSIKKSRR